MLLEPFDMTVHHHICTCDKLVEHLSQIQPQLFNVYDCLAGVLGISASQI